VSSVVLLASSTKTGLKTYIPEDRWHETVKRASDEEADLVTPLQIINGVPESIIERARRLGKIIGSEHGFARALQVLETRKDPSKISDEGILGILRDRPDSGVRARPRKSKK